MPLDHDGKIRMDCSSPYAMASLLAPASDRFAVAFGNDTDADRHGIVTPPSGLMNPNHYLAVAIDYLFTHRAGWPAGAAVGKTLVSSTLIDRVVARARARAARGPGRLQVVRARAAATAASASAARRAPAPASCAATAARGRPTRTASSWTCSPRRSPPSPASDPGDHYERLRGALRHALLHARRRAGHARREVRARASSRPRRSPPAMLAGDADRRQADPRPRQRRLDRRPQGRERQRLVRRPPLRHRERLQDLRREHRVSAAHLEAILGRGARDRRPRPARRLTRRRRARFYATLGANYRF